jgi:acetyltransferase-like isoleucine patch superfamily enzyme
MIRAITKSMMNFISLAIVSPLALLVALEARWSGSDRLFQSASQLMSTFPGLVGDFLRRAFYYWLLDCQTPGPTIGFGTIFAQRDTSIGKNVYIGTFCNIGSCTIGDDVLIGSNVMIASPRIHSFDCIDVPIRLQGGLIEKIPIGDGVWVGNGAIVLSRVESGVVVAAGAVVVKPCERNGIYAGNPAKFIRTRGKP